MRWRITRYLPASPSAVETVETFDGADDGLRSRLTALRAANTTYIYAAALDNTVVLAPAVSSAVETAARQAAVTLVPKASTALPPAAGTKGAVGKETQVFALADHTHEVRARRRRVTLGSDGTFRWVFDRPFATKPGVWAAWESETDKRFVVVYALSDKFETAVVDGATVWTAVTVKGARYQPLPNMGGLTLLAGLVAALTNYDVFGASAAGASVVLMAAEETPTA